MWGVHVLEEVVIIIDGVDGGDAGRLLLLGRSEQMNQDERWEHMLELLYCINSTVLPSMLHNAQKIPPRAPPYNASAHAISPILQAKPS